MVYHPTLAASMSVPTHAAQNSTIKSLSVSDSNSIAPTTQQTSLALQLPHLRLPPVRFRHSIGSSSLLKFTRFPEGETSNESRQKYDKETLDQLSPDECDSVLLCDRVHSNTTV